MSELDRIPDWMTPDTTPGGQLDLKAWAQEFRDVYQISEALCKTPFVPREMLGKQADVAAAIMKGRELGLDPFDALGSIYIVHGRVGYYAEFLRRRIIQAGHTLRIIETNDNRAIIEGIRKDGGEPHRASFTADQARKAALDLGKYPADKLIARATSRLCKQAFPDVLAGSLIAEDLIDGVIPVDTPADTTETPAATKPSLARRRATKPPKAAATQPPAAAAPKPDDSDDMAELLGDDRPVAAAHADLAREGFAVTADAPEVLVAPTPPRQYIPDDERAALYEPVPVSPNQIPLIPDPEPADELQPITPAQLKKLGLLLREEFGDDRAAKHDFTGQAIGRQIDSAKDLSVDEASRVIDILENPAE